MEFALDLSKPCNDQGNSRTFASVNPSSLDYSDSDVLHVRVGTSGPFSDERQATPEVIAKLDEY